MAPANHETLLYALDPVRFARECLEFDPDPHQARILESNANRAILNCSRNGANPRCAQSKYSTAHSTNPARLS